jgi:hypothetical protein
MKTYELQAWGHKHDIYLEKTSYASGGGLAVQMWTVENGELADPWSNLTVNLDHEIAPDCAYIDTNNNGFEICDWIMKNKIAEPTGGFGFSGFCSYPEFRFNMSAFE